MVTNFSTWIESLPAFYQSILGSLALIMLLGVTRYLGQKALILGRQFGANISKTYYEDLLRKDWVRRRFVFGEKPSRITLGHLFVIRESLLRLFRSLFALAFLATIWAGLKSEWLLALGFFIVLNGLSEAISWLRPPKKTLNVPENIRKEFYEKHPEYKKAGINNDEARPI